MRVAIVTAAGRGIGESCARELADRGYSLAIMSPNNVMSVASDLGCTGFVGSITNLLDLQKLVELALEHYGRVDAVINNAGHAPATFAGMKSGYDPDFDRSPLEVTDEEWQDGMHQLLLSVIRMSRLVTPVMQRQRSGAIVNISSYAAFEPRLTYPVSSTMRLALAGFAKLYSDRYAREGIRMNNLLPGLVDNWPVEPAFLRSIPMGRAATLKEIAASAAFLLSSEAGYMTGQNVLVDGGANRSV